MIFLADFACFAVKKALFIADKECPTKNAEGLEYNPSMGPKTKILHAEDFEG